MSMAYSEAEIVSRRLISIGEIGTKSIPTANIRPAFARNLFDGGTDISRRARPSLRWVNAYIGESGIRNDLNLEC